MGLIISYKFIWRILSTNAIAVKKSLQNKVREKKFFVSFNNMNFYEKSRNQQLHNRTALISYIMGYVYFMSTSKSSDSNTNNWYKYYLSLIR